MPPSENPSGRPAIAAANSDDVAPPWSSLPMDLIGLVGWRVLAGDLLDYVRFRAVCTDWRSSTVCPRGRGIVDSRFHPRRWMILPEGHGLHPADGRKRFFNLSTGSFVRVWLPPLSDHRVLASVEGLLLLRTGCLDAAMILLIHPFTGDIVELPPLMTLLESLTVKLDFVASLSVSADGTVAVMIVHPYISDVFFVTTKDKQWRVSTWNLRTLSRPISFQGKLFVLEPRAPCYGGQRILQIDPPSPEHATMPSCLIPPKLIATFPKGEYRELFGVAECDSEIIVIGLEDKPFTNKLELYKVSDLAMGKVAPIPSIGGNTLFLDIKTTIEVQAGDIILSRSMTSNYRAMPTIASDTIVRMRRQCPWQYHLATGKWSLIMGGCVNDGYNMADGCNCGLIYHIYNYCHCREYSMGVLY